MDDQRKDKVTFSAKEQSDGWELLEGTISEDNKGIRFYFDEFSDFESDMAFLTLLYRTILLNK